MPSGSEEYLTNPLANRCDPLQPKKLSVVWKVDREGKAAADSDKYGRGGGGTPLNTHLREDESPGDGSPPSLYPVGQTDNEMHAHNSVSFHTGTAAM